MKSQTIATQKALTQARSQGASRLGGGSEGHGWGRVTGQSPQWWGGVWVRRDHNVVTSLLNTVIFSPVVAISAFLLSWQTVVCHGAARMGAHGPLRGSVPPGPCSWRVISPPGGLPSYLQNGGCWIGSPKGFDPAVILSSVTCVLGSSLRRARYRGSLTSRGTCPA